jgi:hypothetical protein
MSDEQILKTITREFDKVYTDHTKMMDAFTAVNHQHGDMLSAFQKVEKEHERMNREIAEIKEMLKTLLAR